MICTFCGSFLKKHFRIGPGDCCSVHNRKKCLDGYEANHPHLQRHRLGSRKIALKIINDIKQSHPDYIFGELEPFVDKYTKKLPPFNGKIEYSFEGFDRKYNVTYPENFFNGVNYFEVLSNGYYVKKK